MRGISQRRSLGGEKGQGKALVLAVTLLFALLIAVGVATGLWSISGGQEAPTPAPIELAGYHLTHAVAGPQAIAEVNRLHGTAIEIVDAWIGHYQEGGTVWVARASSEEKARQLLDEMIRGIQDGGSPFRGLTRQEIEGVAVYSVRDAGQLHFFYQRVTQVVWVATPPGAEEPFLSEAMRKVG